MRLFALLIVLTIFLDPVNTKAATITNFGGQIVGMITCTCNVIPSWVLYVRDVRYQAPLPLVYYTGVTILHKMYQPRPAVNSLGNYVPGAGICLIYSGNSCFTLPSIGYMFNLGTSMSIGK